MYGYRKWDMDFAGVLADDGEVGRASIILNSNDTLQFYIKIISNPPENFPRGVKEVTGYGDHLSAASGFYDDITLDEESRKQKLREYLNDYILFFRIEQKGEYSYGKDWKIVKKNPSFIDNSGLIAIPIFDESSTQRSKEQFEEQLLLKKYVGNNKQISTEQDDTPSMILWNDNPNGLGEFTLYGKFSHHEHAYGGFRFLTANNEVRKTSLDPDIFFNSYVCGNVMFVSFGDADKLEDELTDGEVIDIIEEAQAPIKEVKQTQLEIPVENDKEEEFLRTFKQQALKMGLYYDEKDLYNFHTAMKTKSLVILAGMSGTGKSKLVQCYANALALNKAQLSFIPVRPSWQDDTDVIGYLDTLNNVYRPGDSGLINTLIKAADDSKNLYIVCFDEMNLARVEHYFSQFLSVLEQEGSNRVLQLYNEGYESRIFNANEYKASLPIGGNVLFVGTVNIDESTYQFSDKVLDRANVLSLGVKSYEDVMKMEEERRKVLSDEEKNGKTKQLISFEDFESFRRKSGEITLTTAESKMLWNLHNCLQESNKNIGIGWRIVKQISQYLENLPSRSPLSKEEAFDIQLVQRVFTKLRGSEEQYTELIGRYNTESKEVEHSAILDELAKLPSSYTMTHSKQVIKEKAKELRLYGHTL